MAVIRFVRACVGLKDEFYNRHMVHNDHVCCRAVHCSWPLCQVKNNLFEPVIATFTANGSRYNLLNSVTPRPPVNEQ